MVKMVLHIDGERVLYGSAVFNTNGSSIVTLFQQQKPFGAI